MWNRRWSSLVDGSRVPGALAAAIRLTSANAAAKPLSLFMGLNESASDLSAETESARTSVSSGGLVLGAVGVLAFSGTLPATRLADPAFGPLAVGLVRAAVAGVLAIGVLLARRTPLLVPALCGRLALIALGVVFGFPLLTSYALARLPSAHAAVLVGLMPAATAGMAVARAGERPRPRYWVALAAGLAAVLAFAASQGAGRPRAADGLLLLAVLIGALGYAEGAVLARRHGGWRVICWTLALSLPAVGPAAVLAVALRPPTPVGTPAWAGMAYLSVVSALLGFFAWYQGMARGGVARVARLQLAQPVLTLAWSALLLGERVSLAAALTSAAVLAAVVLGRGGALAG